MMHVGNGFPSSFLLIVSLTAVEGIIGMVYSTGDVDEAIQCEAESQLAPCLGHVGEAIYLMDSVLGDLYLLEGVQLFLVFASHDIKEVVFGDTAETGAGLA